MLLEKVSVVVDKGAVVDEAVDGMGDVVAAVVVDKGVVVDGNVMVDGLNVEGELNLTPFVMEFLI